MPMGLIDDMLRRIGHSAEDDATAPSWRERLRDLRARSGAGDADIARAVRQLVQGRPTGEPLEDDPTVRALARLLFVETARVAPQALIAVPMLLDLVEVGRGTLDEALAYAESVKSGTN